jgi:putative hydrolase of the HAD superfamily
MKFELIAYDADDTLWHTESYYREVEQRFLDLLAPYGLERDAALARFHAIEIANLPDFGYGIKGFLLSLLEAAINLTGGRVRGADMQAIIDLGRGMVRHAINFLPGAKESVLALSQTHRLALVTKGDLMDQERKISVSGIERYFQHIEILSDKTPDAYARLLSRLQVAPASFLMIGNSMRSDILPVLGIGGWAVHVPYASTWAHESAGEVLAADGARFFELTRLDGLPALVEQIEREL